MVFFPLFLVSFPPYLMFLPLYLVFFPPYLMFLTPYLVFLPKIWNSFLLIWYFLPLFLVFYPLYLELFPPYWISLRPYLILLTHYLKFLLPHLVYLHPYLVSLGIPTSLFDNPNSFPSFLFARSLTPHNLISLYPYRFSIFIFPSCLPSRPLDLVCYPTLKSFNAIKFYRLFLHWHCSGAVRVGRIHFPPE